MLFQVCASVSSRLFVTASAIEERQTSRELIEAMGEMHAAAVAAHGATERRALGLLRGEGQGLLHDLLQLLESKDWQSSSGALEKMAALAMRINARLEGALPGITPEVLEAGALLHDVGKLYVPWSLLNKLAPQVLCFMALAQYRSSGGGDHRSCTAPAA